MPKDNIDEVLNQLAAVVMPIVAQIESNLPTTQNHYGDYMAAISTLADKIPGNARSVKLGVAVAMTKAGGNRAGIIAALKVMGVM